MTPAALAQAPGPAPPSEVDAGTAVPASTSDSSFGPKMEKPAGIPPPANHRRHEMYNHLFLLLLIIVILVRKIKVTIETR